MLTLAEMKTYGYYEVCQYHYPRKGGFCGTVADFVVGDRGACLSHLGQIVAEWTDWAVEVRTPEAYRAEREMAD